MNSLLINVLNGIKISTCECCVYNKHHMKKLSKRRYISLFRKKSQHKIWTGHIFLCKTMATDTSTSKGPEIVFVSGKYAGSTGWINLELEPGRKTIPVIVAQENGKEKLAKVFKSSFELKNKVPTCYAEAVIDQCQDINRELIHLCRQFAMCEIEKDPDGFRRVVEEKVVEAIQWQKNKAKPLYRKIE